MKGRIFLILGKYASDQPALKLRQTIHACMIFRFFTKMPLVLGNTLDFLFYPILTLISMLFHMLLEEKVWFYEIMQFLFFLQ